MALRRLACTLLLAAIVVAGSAVPASAAVNRYTLPSGRTYSAWKDVPTVTTAVLALHSFNHDDDEPIAQGWLDAAATNNFLAVFPTGSGSWNAGLCCGSARATGRDDVGYLADVIADVKARWRPTNVYVTGWSNGGMMAERLVLERPRLTNRIVVAGAAPEMLSPGSWPGRAWIYHGGLDTTVPWTGKNQVPWCACEIRRSQATRTFIRGASLWALVDPNRGHVPPRRWPFVAWTRLSSA
jgi:polyhydroxybutyrate depolymerase